MLLLTVFPAAARQAAACDQFAWPIGQERNLFEAPSLLHLRSGETLKLASAQAAAIDLKGMDEVRWTRQPERAPKKPDTHGGVLGIESVSKPGLYQITLSDEAWIDVVQNGAFVKSSAHSGKQGCPGVRKSVRFELDRGPLIVQISGAEAGTIKFSILPVKE